MDSTPGSYRGHRFPPEIISHAVWLVVVLLRRPGATEGLAPTPAVTA